MTLLYLISYLIGIALAVEPILFHGTSVVIIPSNETSAPENSTVLAANFFCYMGDKGYFSFGWYVPTTSNSNTTHCRPDSQTFHWYEHARLESCSKNPVTCTYTTQNFPIRSPIHAKPLPLPENPVQYTIKPLDIGNGDYGKIAVSYIDDDDSGLRVYGIGTREVLSGSECQKALGTLKWSLKKWDPNLGFILEDVCGGLEDSLKVNKVQDEATQVFFGEL